jgi:hypothetical protein
MFMNRVSSRPTPPELMQMHQSFDLAGLPSSGLPRRGLMDLNLALRIEGADDL